MRRSYCIVPDEDKLKKFWSELSFSEVELMQLHTLKIKKICLNDNADEWEVYYTSCGNLPERMLRAMEEKLSVAFSLESIAMVREETESVQEREIFVTDCSGKPLPEEGYPDASDGSGEYSCASDAMDCFSPDGDRDEDFRKAYDNLYGEKKTEGLLWGKKIKGTVRAISSVTEEENRVVVEGDLVQIFDKDMKFVDYVERVLKTGAIVLTFGISDESGGIYVRMRFDDREGDNPKESCRNFKSLLKNGMRLRVKGNVSPDKYLYDELVLQPTGIMGLEKAERLDNAPVKRVELHCHTKMSKMDALTDMKDIVNQAVKWGHKALAITDHGVVQAFPACYAAAEKSDLKLIFGMEGYLISDHKLAITDIEQEAAEEKGRAGKNKVKSNHIIILAKNEIGLINLYKLVSISHLRYLNRRPLLPRQIIEEYREGLLLGSACEAGELYQAVRSGVSDEQLEKIASFYDYLEIQPLGNNDFLVRENICNKEELQAHNMKIYQLGKKLGKPTVATCDVHFLNPEDGQLRAILQAGQNYKDFDLQPPVYFRTTEEMLREFSYMGEEIAYEVCVTNTNKIADMVERIKPIPDRDQLYSPSIPGAEDAVRSLSYQKAREWYGDELPSLVEDRLKMELDAIIGNGFSVLYYIAHKLVTRSLNRGYLVGSRGSVGSSFVATMLDITEVNPLEPHYRCPQCRHSEFFRNQEYDSGFDLPGKVCPICGTQMLRDGHEIPFAVFLGFHGDKVPDIDLNFSGGVDPDDPEGISDQAAAHKYTEELFGRSNVCRAGTISTIASRTAFGFVKKYYEAKNKNVHSAHIAAMAKGIAGVKRTTGQHPGGIMVIPRNMDIHYITPMNRPADDIMEKTITTHYDYHSINDRLVKLDILGHDDPMVLKMLEKYIREDRDPDFDPKKIPIGDEETMRIFQETSSLGVEPEQIGSQVGTFGIPECGTHFVRQMIYDVRPKLFSELVRVSGYSHGTDVWLNNAQSLIKEGKSVKETISTRDDIMTNLIAKGVEPNLAFKTMEHVRKGAAAKKGLEPHMLQAMKEVGIPDWYINSCEKVQYLFPKAHAVAYVLMAYRIAYCKVHYPKEFYAAYFSVRAKDFDYTYIAKGAQFIKKYIRDTYEAGYKASAQEKSTVTYLELANEMMERGFIFEPIDIYSSDPLKFEITKRGLRPPLAAISGVGETAANSIAASRDPNNPFISREDLRQRAGVSKAVIEKLTEIGILDDLPEDNQISLFG